MALINSAMNTNKITVYQYPQHDPWYQWNTSNPNVSHEIEQTIPQIERFSCFLTQMTSPRESFLSNDSFYDEENYGEMNSTKATNVTATTETEADEFIQKSIKAARQAAINAVRLSKKSLKVIPQKHNQGNIVIMESKHKCLHVSKDNDEDISQITSTNTHGHELPSEHFFCDFLVGNTVQFGK